MKKFILVALLLTLCYSVATIAQTVTLPVNTEVKTTKTSVKIISSNPTVVKKIIDVYALCQCLTTSNKWKKDRNGKYLEYTLTLPLEKYNDLLTLFAVNTKLYPFYKIADRLYGIEDRYTAPWIAAATFKSDTVNYE